MKKWNSKNLALSIGGLLLLALTLPGLAPGEKKRTFAPRVGLTKPGAARPGAASPAGKGPLLRAKVNPKLIVAHKLAAKKFAPFALKDLKDPKTGKAPAANTMITLHNGVKITAAKHLDAVNKLESKLNAWGYTLRGKAQRVTIQQMVVSKNKLKGRAPPNLAFMAKMDARSQALAASPNLLQQEFAKAKATRIAMRPIGGLGGLTGGIPLQGVSTVKTFEDGWGDPSVFGASIKAQLALKGDQNGTSISAEGRATGSVLGHSEDLVLATASLAAPRAGGMSAKFKITTLGIDQVALDKSEPASWTQTDTFSRSLPDNLRVEYHFSIGPIPMSAEVGVRGNAKFPYFVGLTPGSTTGWMIPEVQSSVYAQGAVDAEVDLGPLDAGVEAGVEAQLTLLDNKLTVAGGIDQGKDSKGTFIKDWYTSRDDFKALAGKLVVYAEVHASLGPIGGSKRFDYVFWDFGGIQRTETPFGGGETRYLQPLAVRQ